MPKEDGFSLIELLVGAVILSIIVLMFSQMLKTPLDSNIMSNDLNNASILCAKLIDSLKLTDFFSIDPNYVHTQQVGRYQLEWLVFDQSSAPPNNQVEGMKLINVRVNWTRNNDHSFTLSTLIAEMF